MKAAEIHTSTSHHVASFHGCDVGHSTCVHVVQWLYGFSA